MPDLKDSDAALISAIRRMEKLRGAGPPRRTSPAGGKSASGGGPGGSSGGGGRGGGSGRGGKGGGLFSEAMVLRGLIALLLLAFVGAVWWSLAGDEGFLQRRAANQEAEQLAAQEAIREELPGPAPFL